MQLQDKDRKSRETAAIQRAAAWAFFFDDKTAKEAIASTVGMVTAPWRDPLYFLRPIVGAWNRAEAIADRHDTFVVVEFLGVVTGMQDLAEGIVGIDVASGQDLDTLERWSRGLTGGGQAGLSLAGGLAVGRLSAPHSLSNARFAQLDYDEVFSPTGVKVLSKLGGGRIVTIDDLAAAIKAGRIKPQDVPVNFIQRGHNTLILNTRTSAALRRAGVPRSQWNGVNRTGDAFFEGLLDGQLRRNNLTNEGVIQPMSSRFGM